MNNCTNSAPLLLRLKAIVEAFKKVSVFENLHKMVKVIREYGSEQFSLRVERNIKAQGVKLKKLKNQLILI